MKDYNQYKSIIFAALCSIGILTVIGSFYKPYLVKFVIVCWLVVIVLGFLILYPYGMYNRDDIK